MRVMNVLGYSESHRSTFFSASIRSLQAFCPTVSRAWDSSDDPEDDEWKSEKDFGRPNRWRMPMSISPEHFLLTTIEYF